MLAKGYAADQSELGNVYYPNEGIAIPDNICVNLCTEDEEAEKKLF